jgi:hypothetical protein
MVDFVLGLLTVVSLGLLALLVYLVQSAHPKNHSEHRGSTR